MKYEDIEKYIEAYTQKPSKILWYKTCFQHYYYSAFNSIGLKWSWLSFFFVPLVLMYRKCYIEALIAIVTIAVLGVFSPVLAILVHIISGFLVPYLIYRRFKRVVELAKAQFSDDEAQVLEVVKRYGGTSGGLVILGLVIAIIVGGITEGSRTRLFMPFHHGFSGYKQHKYNRYHMHDFDEHHDMNEFESFLNKLRLRLDLDWQEDEEPKKDN